MTRFKRTLKINLFFRTLLLASMISAPFENSLGSEFNKSRELQQKLDRAVKSTLEKFGAQKLLETELAATLIDLRDSANPELASYRGSVRIYPASVIKLFYLEAAHRWMEDGKIRDTVELRRAMHDMIVDSYNEATHYVLDILTDTTSGPELPPDQMEEWEHKRNAVNRYFLSRGYANINANQKPWCEGPYGRDRIFVGQNYTNRNALTTDATATLLGEMVLGKAVSQKRSNEMLELLKRDPFGKSADPDDQSHAFSGPAIPEGGKLWSKAGWTSETRHDATYVELPNGARFILVIFTVNHANEREIIPTLARIVISEFSKSRSP
jgi:beta-lactamase class A